MARLETEFRTQLVKDLEELLPGCIVLYNDAQTRQGIPDLVVFYGNRYGFLEVKRSEKETRQPNQTYYTELFNEWSYGAVIYPENRELILDEIQRALGSRRLSRRS